MAEHGGHRRRRRALFEAAGGEGWEEARLLELVLFEAIPRGDVYPLARRLLERFGSVAAVSAAPEEELLRERGFKAAAMALTDDSVPVDDPCPAGEPRLAIVLGPEGDGLAPSTVAACDYTVKIPMYRGVDSLNVSAAAAVALYALTPRVKNDF